MVIYNSYTCAHTHSRTPRAAPLHCLLSAPRDPPAARPPPQNKSEGEWAADSGESGATAAAVGLAGLFAAAAGLTLHSIRRWRRRRRAEDPRRLPMAQQADV
jgi:hypothetical protein